MDKVLKQRLIGASILIALAVIFVPMLFEGPQDASESRELNIELPNAPGDRAPVRRLPLDPQQSRTQAQVDESEAARSGEDRIEPTRIEPSPIEPATSRDELMAEIESQVRETETRESDTVEAAESTTASAVDETDAAVESVIAPVETTPTPAAEPQTPSPQAEPVQDSAEAARGFEVQVASFGSLQNAEDLIARLTQLGHVATIDRLVRGPSELHRVRTGPYQQRADAERALAQIQQTVPGVQPVIVGSAPAVLPERTSDTGFAVQVGSFASRNNAVRLLDQLAGQGYDAFVHQDTAGSRTIWRVRVGPLGSREEAVQRLARMTEQDGIDGLVVSHP